MTREEIETYFERNSELEEKRTQWLSHWQEIQEYALPDQGFFAQTQVPNQGEKRHSKIVNGTAEIAISTFAAGMQGGLTSPSRPWFRLTVADTELAEFAPVRAWLDYVERAMYQVFAKSNFYGCVLSLYTDLGGFGTGSVYSEEKPDSLIWFRNCAVGEYCVAEGQWGMVDTLYRRTYETVRNLAAKFGKNALSDSLQLTIDASPQKMIQILHAVQPRENYDPEKLDAKNMPFESVYLEWNNTEKPLWVGGYQEFPYFVPRWNTSGPDCYGRSPAMRVLDKIKMLQEVEKTGLKALHKSVDPPMKRPSSLKGRLSIIPGADNVIDSSDDKQVGALYTVQPDLKGLQAKIQDLEMAIREGMFNNLFLAILSSGGQMTAREVAERHEEKLLMIGPFIERHALEFHEPCIDRLFAILARRGVLPPPPQELSGMDLKVEYISLLAQAQKMVGTSAIRSTADFVGALAGFKPDVLDKFDADEAVDQFAEMVGAPSKIIISDDKVAEIRAARQQQIQQQKEEAQALAELGAVKTLGDTNTQEGSALGDLAGALGAV